ncbi:MAG: addiction module protein [Planctomycetes bacterium]|nr:addiction module protein [Planctomycetota bacterium]
MRTTYREVAEEAFKLSPKARAKLARELLRSLEPTGEAEIDRLWLEEAKRRDRELDAGQAALPIDQVLARARAVVR